MIRLITYSYDRANSLMDWIRRIKWLDPRLFVEWGTNIGIYVDTSI